MTFAFANKDGTLMAEIKRIEPADIERAILAPASIFTGPEDVLEHDELTREQKIEALWRWEYDAAGQAVALEEGMPGEESDLLRRVLLALGTLVGPINVERTGPTKQHALARPVVDRR